MTRYEHTQIGHVIIWPLLAIILIASGGSIGHHAPPVIVSIILLVCVVAVAITLRDRRKIALGTDDPHGLIAAIRDSIIRA